jgi:hypothetical protein
LALNRRNAAFSIDGVERLQNPVDPRYNSIECIEHSVQKLYERGIYERHVAGNDHRRVVPGRVDPGMNATEGTFARENVAR